MLDQTKHGALDPPVSVSHLVRTLGAYSPIIGLAMLAVIIGYIVVAAAVFALAPSQRTTTLPFRLEFEGADRGEYPNGTKFAAAEIVTTPVLLRVYKDNNLGRFMDFDEFSNAVIVLQSNRAHDELSREYQARLSEPKLTAVDRERIQREYQLKLDSLSKDQYSINYVGSGVSGRLPETLERKVLHDVLRAWADFVSKEQHVLEYRVAVLAPDIVAAVPPQNTNPVIAAQMLRSNILRVLANISQIRSLAGSELVRTADGFSLDDISFRFDELVRFRLEPIAHRIAAAGLDNRAESIRFLEAQLAYDERQLAALKRAAESHEKALAIYMNRLGEGNSADAVTLTPPVQGSAPGQETVMPQLNESFIDRLISLTSNYGDSEYRQRLTDDYRRASLSILPLEQAVAYDRSVVAAMRSPGASDGITREQARQDIDAARSEVRNLVLKVHEIYRLLSRSLNPSKELLTVTGGQSTRVERAVGIKRLALYGILTCFIALPIIVILCLIHNRIREEEAEDDLGSSLNAVELSAQR
jgi:hypothetical protein